ncbi:glycoside hydrolase family 32 protein [Allostreptomyces psammosilenae]|uniref:beta-fructofuranosidase n=1 Tax=Allostreptomyces psammosilenae TaxID=1892865 RepID=A0A852ZMY4_9ACTN|nr:glycoside hydrolase family 32 protein [Allostreptomyces psammosilenae]NYI03773.1 beta-fructofuranosidase [Allostreptomyces psammosilenae]
MTGDLTLPRATGAAREDLATRAERDPQRPRFHFVSPAGWLNDPNGLSHWKGVYHLFYQYNPYGPVHHRIHWGHATSTDLVTWTDEPVALVPSEGPDVDGCWSGVLVDDGGVPTLVYSGRHGERELPCVATGSPDLRSWEKHPGNPVVAAPPEGVEVTAFRDHCVWREGGTWRQLVGSGVRGVGGAAFLYESADLRSWRYVGPLLTGDAGRGGPGDLDWTGTMWECVDLFRLPAPADPAHAADGTPAGSATAEGTDVLVFSAWDEGVTHHPLYWTGRYAGDTFTPTALHRLDYGQRYFYAPQSTRDAHGRRVMFGWLQEGRGEAATAEAGWCGVMSLPRLVTMGTDGRLAQRPVPEVDRLRREHAAAGPLTLGGGEHAPLDDVRGDQLDLVTTLRLEPGATARLTVRATPDGAERTVVEIERRADGTPGADGGTLRLRREHSSLDPTVDTDPRHGPVPIGADGVVELRVLVDHSALEIFAGGRALAARVYPTRADALGVGLTATGTLRVERFDAWRMADVWTGAPRPLWP